MCMFHGCFDVLTKTTPWWIEPPFPFIRRTSPWDVVRVCMHACVVVRLHAVCLRTCIHVWVYHAQTDT